MTTYAGVFPYISVVDAPGSAYFTVKNVPSTGEVVVNASLACMPMVVLMSMFAWLAGIIIWILVRNSHRYISEMTVIKGFHSLTGWSFSLVVSSMSNSRSTSLLTSASTPTSSSDSVSDAFMLTFTSKSISNSTF